MIGIFANSVCGLTFNAHSGWPELSPAGWVLSLVQMKLKRLGRSQA